jgi:heme A synthase
MVSNLSLILIFHSLIRWAVLIVFVYTFISLLLAVLKSKESTPKISLGVKITMILIDIQILVGLSLYIFQSPIIVTALSDMKAAMKMKEMRFFFAEHPFMMIIAAIFIHAAVIIGKKDIAIQKKNKIILYLYLGIVLCFIFGIPWFRPLLRWF